MPDSPLYTNTRLNTTSDADGSIGQLQNLCHVVNVILSENHLSVLDYERSNFLLLPGKQQLYSQTELSENSVKYVY